MPLYEYECNDCQHRFEEVLKVSDRDGDVRCPKCYYSATRQVTKANFRIHGYSAANGYSSNNQITPSADYDDDAIEMAKIKAETGLEVEQVPYNSVPEGRKLGGAKIENGKFVSTP